MLGWVWPLLIAGAPLAVQERRPVDVLLSTPSGAAGRVSSSELLAMLGELLLRHTDLAPRLVEGSAVSGCEGRIRCLAARTRALNAEPASHLILLSSWAQANAPDRLRLELVEGARLGAENPFDAADDSAAEEAVRARTRLVAVESKAEAQAFLARTFAEDLRRPWEETGHWEPLARVGLDAPPGWLVELDGTPVGVTSTGTTELVHLLPGKRRLRLSAASGEAWTTELELSPRAHLRLLPDLPQTDAPLYTRGLFWAGAGATLVGGALLAVGLVETDGASDRYCLLGPSSCTSGQFARSGQPRDAPTSFRGVEGGGVPLVPLGYSLALAGLVWTLFGLFDEGASPAVWWQAALGAGAGGLSFALSLALEPRGPFGP